MDRNEAMRWLAAIGADQWGLVTTRQAQAAGLNRMDLGRLVDADLLLRVVHGVYQLAGSTPTRDCDIKAAWLRLDPEPMGWERIAAPDDRTGVISHTSACRLHGIGDIPSDDVEISVSVRRTTRESGVTIHKAAIPTDDITIVDGLPVTTVDRTICDLLRSRADGGHIGGVLADADERGLTDTRELAARVQPYARAYGLSRTASGTDLLNFLADQAGFTLRDERLTAAGARAAIHSAINPQVLVPVLGSPNIDAAELLGLTGVSAALNRELFADAIAAVNAPLVQAARAVMASVTEPAMQNVLDHITTRTQYANGLTQLPATRAVIDAIAGLVALPPSMATPEAGAAIRHAITGLQRAVKVPELPEAGSAASATDQGDAGADHEESGE